MVRNLSLLALATFLCAAIAPSASANTIYTYTGNPYPSSTCPPVCFLSGSVTFANPLAASTSTGVVTPLSFSFSDGNLSVNSTGPGAIYSQFAFVTGATGAIVEWYIYLPTGLPTALTSGDILTCFALNTTSPPNVAPACPSLAGFDGSYNPSTGGIANVYSSPGTWGGPPPVVTPEPSGVLLLGSGLMALVGVARRRLHS